MEALESRLAPANVVGGAVYNDLDGGGTRGLGEPGLAGWTVYLDLNDDGARDDGEPGVVTDVLGGYSFTGLQPGDYVVRAVVPAGWAQTAPKAGFHTATVVDETTAVLGLDFGAALLSPSSVAGVKFHDLNGDGARDAGEPGLPGWTIYLDQNGNGQLDAGERSAVTDAQGNYVIPGLEAGPYVVREVPQSGWAQSAPSAGFHAVELEEGQDVGGLDFGNYRPVTLSGIVFHDVNGNGALDPGEPGLPGWTVFVDLDGSGTRDPGEPFAVTNSQGSYTIANVRPGAVTLVQVLQANWVQTLPEEGPRAVTAVSGVNQTNLNFGNKSGTVRGLVFNDTNGNGTRDAGEGGLAGWRVYLDLNDNGVLDTGEPNAITGAQGEYLFGGLAPRTYVIRQVPQSGWVQTAPAAGFHTAVIEDASTLAAGRDFGFFRLISVSGTVYNDVNGNGTRDPGEPGLPNWIVYLDANNDGVFNPGEASTVTDASGAYALANLGPGTYRVRLVPLPGWAATGPAGGVYVITTASGVSQTGRDFGNRLLDDASVSGQVFDDRNDDGVKDEDEPGLANWTVFADLNDDGFLDANEPRAVTDAQGNYTLAGLVPGTYALRVALQSGWAWSTPSAGFFRVTVAPGQAVTGLDFGNFRLVSLSGVVFRDVNGDGVRQAGEPGLPNWTVYADLNDNGILDANEPRTVTGAQGSYTLSNIGPGAVVLRQVLQPNWTQTAPEGGAYTLTAVSGVNPIGLDFGNRAAGASGVVFRDLNGDGIRQAGEPGLAGWPVYADLNGNGVRDATEPQTSSDAQGNYLLAGLPVGTFILRQVVPSGWVATAPAAGFHTVTIEDADALVTGLDFGAFQRISVSGTVYHDLNGDGTRQAGEPGLAGWTVYVDVNGDGQFTPGEPSATTGSQGTYTLANLGPGTHAVRVLLPAPWAQTAPAGGAHAVTAVSGQNVTGRDFGARSATVTGQVFDDRNGDGVRQAGEPGLSNWTVYADLNNNGILDANEPRALTNAQGNYTLGGLPTGTFSLRAPQSGWVVTAPGSGFHAVTIDGTDTLLADINFGNFRLISVSGTVYHDVNGDGTRQAGEPGVGGARVYADVNGDGQFTPGEPSATTGSQGTYTLANLGPGTHTVRVLLPAPWAQTAPAGGAHVIAAVSGQSPNGRDFGARSATVTGTKFHDLNGDGVRQAGEPGLSGWTVYADLNNNGILDANEPRAVTNAQGAYTLGGLPAGTFFLREAAQPGWVVTAPAVGYHTVTTEGTTTLVAGRDFGNFQFASVSGTVFHDVNANGTRQADEPTLAGWTVFDDRNDNGMLDPGEPSVTTSSSGTYFLQNVGPGTHTVRVLVPVPWAQTAPAGGAHVVTPASGQSLSGRNFGAQSATVTGQIFNDLNGDGTRDPGEPGLPAGFPAWAVYADLNDNGVLDANEPWASPNAQGTYVLGGLPAGTVILREVVRAGWVLTSPAAGFQAVEVEDITTRLTGRDFGNFQRVSVSGAVFNDVNGNGTRDPGERGLAGWIVFDDLNNDGVLDPGEPSAVTNTQGNYSLAGVGPGTHFIRQVPLPGWDRTAPPPPGAHVITTASGQSVTGRDFGNRLVAPAAVSGRVFDDLNADGTRQAGEPGLQGWRVYIDANNNGQLDAGEQFADSDAQGDYTLTGLPPGTYTVRAVPQAGWLRSAPPAGFYAVTLTTGQAATGRDFGHYQRGSVAGVKFHDLNGDGVRDEGEPGLPGWTVYLDLDDNGRLDQVAFSLEPDDYPEGSALTTVIPQATVRDEIGGVVRSAAGDWVSTGTRVFTSSFFGTFFHGPGQGLRVDFTSPVSSVSIDAIGSAAAQLGLLRVFNAADQELARFTTNPLDLGQMQTMTLIRTAGDIAYAIASAASFSYSVFLDNLRFVTGEPSAVTNAQGGYSFTGLDPGEYVLREVPRPGWVQTAPAEGFHVVTVLSGQNVTGLDFGNVEEEEEGGPPVGPAGAPSPFADVAALLAGPPTTAGNYPPAAGTNTVRAAEGSPKADTAARDRVFAALGGDNSWKPAPAGRGEPWPDDWFAKVFGEDLWET